MFKCSHLSLTLKNDNQIVKNLNLILNEGDKVALIGEEGNGKSTLMKFLYDPNLIEPYCFYEGSTNLKREEIGYLPQSLGNEWLEVSTLDYLLKQDADSELDYELYQHVFEVEQLFDRFSLDKELFHHPRLIKTLSGGEKIKLQFIKLLLQNPKLYLLDEPTNDLDMETLLLFEDFLIHTKVPLIFISHDETLLANVANQILHLEQIKRQKLAKYNYEKIGYEAYIAKRNRSIDQHNRDAHRTQKDFEKRRLTLMHQHLLVENHQDRAMGKNPSEGRVLAKKMKNVKLRERKLAEMEVLDYYKKEEAMNLFFDDSIKVPKSKVILDLKLDELKAGSKVLARNISLQIVGPEHIVIYGPNGSGKTSLIKEILKGLERTPSISYGYMPQDYTERFDESISAVEYLQTKLGYETKVKAQMMTFLGALNFIESEMTSPILSLSGGLKAKLYLLEMVLSRYDVLILDEPTRNLSPLSNPVVRAILNQYGGAIIMVSHDRKLIEEVATTTYQLSSEGLSASKLRDI